MKKWVESLLGRRGDAEEVPSYRSGLNNTVKRNRHNQKNNDEPT